MKVTLETRLRDLEKRLAALETNGAKAASRPWLKHFGWAKDDPIYDEAMKLGAAYRRRRNR
jgi:hypothetical protein